MDDVERARARRIAWSRVVVLVVAVAFAALLTMTVVGALRSGTTHEVGLQKLAQIGPVIP